MDSHHVTFTLAGRRLGYPPTHKQDLIFSVMAEALWMLLQHHYTLGEGTGSMADVTRAVLTGPAYYTVVLRVNYPGEDDFQPGDYPEKMMDAIRCDLAAAGWTIDTESVSVIS